MTSEPRPDRPSRERRPKITIAEFERMIAADVPMCNWLGFRMEEIGWGRARLRQKVRPEFLRPGGVVCGPVSFALVDVAMYAVVFSLIGPVKLATTTNLAIHFMRPTKPGDLIVAAEAIGSDERFITSRATVGVEGDDEPACFATGTYSVPPR